LPESHHEGDRHVNNLNQSNKTHLERVEIDFQRLSEQNNPPANQRGNYNYGENDEDDQDSGKFASDDGYNY